MAPRKFDRSEMWFSRIVMLAILVLLASVLMASGGTSPAGPSQGRATDSAHGGERRGTLVRGSQAATTPAPTTACGQVAVPKPGGGEWQCTFDDEFTGSSLDPSKWVAQQTATSGYTTGAGAGTVCYVDSPENVHVAGGVLDLTVRRVAPFTCPDPDGDFTTNYTGGMVSTYGLFSQSYGLFEVRAKLPATDVAGLQEALWLWPVDPTRYGPWPASGEIDFGEFYSQYAALDIPQVHYTPASPDPDVTSYSCLIAQIGQFNTYAIVWTSTSITILDDGQTCLVDRWHPAPPLTAPKPFDQPFIVALTQALGIGANALDPGVTPLPATTEIDWVRVFK